MGKQIIRDIIKSFLVVFLVAGVVYAASVSQFSSGETLTTTKINAIVDNLVPSGAVMSFDLDSCPTGWSEYTPAYGRFIRGIDKSGTNIDPSGQRVRGNVQGDAIRNITGGTGATTSWNQALNNVNIIGSGALYTRPIVGAGGNLTGTQFNQWREVHFNAARQVPTAGDNRPKNVALLYCKKD